jgi:hypothetical protein
MLHLSVEEKMAALLSTSLASKQAQLLVRLFGDVKWYFIDGIRVYQAVENFADGSSGEERSGSGGNRRTQGHKQDPLCHETQECWHESQRDRERPLEVS